MIDPVTAHIDSSYRPQDNFFLFANNTWFKQHPIPSSESSNGIFRTIQDTINESIRSICEKASKDAGNAKGSNKQKIGDFYFSGMDTTSMEHAGTKELEPILAKISGIKTTADLITTVNYLHTIEVPAMYGFDIYKDEKNSSQYIAILGQCQLGLPERDYYLNPDASTTNIRKEYRAHIQKMLELSGEKTADASKEADAVMNLEMDLAKACRKMEDLRDPYKNYNKMDVAGINKLMPSGNWNQGFTELGLTKVDSIVVGQPEFFSSLDKLIKNKNIEDWKSYLKWSVYNEFSRFLNRDLRKQNFYFYSTVLDGVTEEKPRWKVMVETTDFFLGDLIGQVYVDEYLPKGTKEKLLEIGNNIRDVYADHIKQLDWMSEQTKEKALVKLQKITMKVGYPDKWKDLSSLEISRDNFMHNVLNVFSWNYQYMIHKYGKPVDRSEWDMYPQTYNAYYDPTNNEIVVPACNIIVPGFEGRMPDDAVLYGIIGGSTFGHEITHGFDDQGSQYDENGNLRDWWTQQDRDQFVSRTQQIVSQFNGYTVSDSLHLNGENTQGENIADLGGVIMGLEAFKKTAMGKSSELINGFTPEQRYFLAYAYAWMVNKTPASEAKQVRSNVHSPAAYRVIGPLSDVDEFYKAFNVKSGDKMFRAEKDRVKIW